MSLDPDRIRGALLGVAVGDALGLPAENLTAKTIARRLAPLDRYRLFLRTGWISDDTEQTAMVAEALLESRVRDPAAVARAFARRLRVWFLLLPAGIGLATVRACLKLFLFVPASRSGVRSAGNGASMRAVPIALAEPLDAAVRDALAVAVARVTHTDRRAVDGARLVAHAAARLLAAAGKVDRASFVRELAALVGPEPELGRALERTAVLIETGASRDAAASDLGTSGFVVHTVPFALFCALRFVTFPEAVRAAAEAGGDTDTIAAIAGGLAGCLHGASAIPEAWVLGLEQRGRGRRHLEALAACFANEKAPAPRASLVYRMGRALFFLVIVFIEVSRRVVDAPVAFARGEWKR
jgi:ADP-ribosylglycohydrolase